VKKSLHNGKLFFWAFSFHKNKNGLRPDRLITCQGSVLIISKIDAPLHAA
jgi:hypothetical protein